MLRIRVLSILLAPVTFSLPVITLAADLAAVEAALQAEGARWTPGRTPDLP